MTTHVSYEIPTLRVGVWPAQADYSAQNATPGFPDLYQFLAVQLVAPGAGVDGYSGAAIQVPSASGGAILGILQDNPKQNIGGDVWMTGISKAYCGNTITIGQILMTNASGQFIPATSGNFGVAMALSAGSSGDYIAVWLANFGKQ